MNIQTVSKLDPKSFTVIFLTEESVDDLNKKLPDGFPKLNKDHADNDSTLNFFDGNHKFVVQGVGKGAELEPEKLRKQIHAAVARANKLKEDSLQLVLFGASGSAHNDYLAIALGETPELSNYQWLPYFQEETRKKKQNSLQNVTVLTDLNNAKELVAYGQTTTIGTCAARDLVNEPPNTLTPVEMANRAKKLGEEHGYTTTIFDKKKLQELGFGGLLGVNMGSQDPPTFTIMEYKPDNAKNSKPIVIVGKGVTFDTGGINLKPSSSINTMKSDMGGAAAAIGTMVSVAANKLPYHVIGLVPSTDNRPGEKAITPNDILTMYDGTFVEVLNTDAEGRLILADALAYAKQYDPALVIDLATLTGAAVVAVGNHTTAMMGTADDTTKRRMSESGHNTFERVWECRCGTNTVSC